MVQAFWSYTVAYVHRALTEEEGKGLEVTFHAFLEIRIEHLLEANSMPDALEIHRPSLQEAYPYYRGNKTSAQIIML